MRVLAFLTTAAVAALIVSPASAAWKEFKYEDLGIVKEFPADPKVTDGQYKTPVAGTNPAKIFTVEQDNAIYRMTVVNLSTKLDKSATILGECVFLAEDAGSPIANMMARIEPGAAAVYGRIQTTDLPDKSRALTECLFTKGNLYKIEAIILPANDDYPNSSQAIRFINSLSFNMKGEG